MEKETREEKYKKLREEINDMNNVKYDNPYQLEPEDETGDIAMSEDEIQEEHIKKNTLSISIDQIVKAHDEYTTMISQEEIEKEKQKVNELNRKKFLIKLAIICGAIFVVALIVVLIIIFGK